ncbi:esterase-like activity of phytase family protein [Comamonas sp. GB3 AK4-5]|uniref:esterase-like activity of phytase family protein n=1 Tax=Comamonas sp. GB3 AK4-5 TaxID=3231487 RepID=UPI00351F1018
MKQWQTGWILGLLPLLAACTAQPVAPTAWVCNGSAAPCVRAIGMQTLARGMDYQGTTVGGLSAIDYDPAHDRWLLLSDDRSAHQPARFYTAQIRYSARQLEPVQLTGVVLLQAPDGLPYPSARQARVQLAVPDPEAARWAPGGDSLLWTSEGDPAHGHPPQWLEHHSDGRWLRERPLPALLSGPWKGQSGPRNNGTLEGMALSPDGRTTWLAMEEPLRQDGPVATPQAPGGAVRITAFDTASGQALRQLAYQPDAIPHARRVPLGPQNNGVSEILADGTEHLLVLERAYSAGVGVSVRLYRVALNSGSDTLNLAALQPGQYRPVAKTLVADMAQLGLPQAVDNLEGMGWGPSLADGSRVLLLVSDDNFNPAQTTQFIALAWRNAPATVD